uniref:Peptidase_M13 domain-containing protein n=1 Tax=Strongyloides stercoralis TaxID=6248 RepID=A0A0K0EGK7_STRER
MKSFFILITFHLTIILLIQKKICFGQINPEDLKYNPEITASSLKKYLDESTNPCDDFYQFSCGKWIEKKKTDNIFDVELNQFAGYIKFIRYKKEFVVGNFNDRSPTIKKIHKLLAKCFDSTGQNYDKTCASKILSFSNNLLLPLFLDLDVNKELMEHNYGALEKMFGQLKNELKDIIEKKKDFIDDESKEKIYKKLNSLTFSREYSNYAFDFELMEKCYEFFPVNENDSLEQMYDNIDKFENMNINDIFIPDDVPIKNKCKFIMSANNSYMIQMHIRPNAYYSNEGNIMLLTPYIIQEPRFNLKFPKSLNYGALGFAMSHEILHGFDSIGIMYDSNGEEGSKLLTESSENKFNEAAKCFEKQYNETQEERTKLFLNGYKSLAENLADNSGIKLAHRTYMKYLETTGEEEPRVPGFEKYTNEQLFFINFARSFCEYKEKDSYIINQLQTEHVPNKFRINLSLANYKPFSTAFSCGAGTKMNPSDKCELWRMFKHI